MSATVKKRPWRVASRGVAVGIELRRFGKERQLKDLRLSTIRKMISAGIKMGSFSYVGIFSSRPKRTEEIYGVFKQFTRLAVVMGGLAVRWNFRGGSGVGGLRGSGD
jgi:hypothetical protein